MGGDGKGKTFICQPVRAGLKSLYLILPSVMHSFSYTCSLCHWLSDLPQKTVKTSSLTSGNHNSQLYLFCFYFYTCRNCQFLQALLYWENVLVMQIALIHGRVLQTLSLSLQGILFFDSLCCVSSSPLIWIALLIKVFEKSIRGEQVSAFLQGCSIRGNLSLQKRNKSISKWTQIPGNYR